MNCVRISTTAPDEFKFAAALGRKIAAIVLVTV
jgi:hypothetical protein